MAGKSRWPLQWFSETESKCIPSGLKVDGQNGFSAQSVCQTFRHNWHNDKTLTDTGTVTLRVNRKRLNTYMCKSSRPVSYYWKWLVRRNAIEYRLKKIKGFLHIWGRCILILESCNVCQFQYVVFVLVLVFFIIFFILYYFIYLFCKIAIFCCVCQVV